MPSQPPLLLPTPLTAQALGVKVLSLGELDGSDFFQIISKGSIANLVSLDTLTDFIEDLFFPLPISLGGTGATTAVQAALNLFTAYRVTSAALVRTTFTSFQPLIVVTAGFAAVEDGGGGTWVWDATSVATDNGGTVIKVSGVTTGRYRRLYSGAINIQWFIGAPPATSVASTLNTIMALGGAIEFPANTGPWNISSVVTMSVANTSLSLNGCTLQATATMNGTMLLLSGVNASVMNGTISGTGGSTNITQLLYLAADGTSAFNMTLTAASTNPRRPNSYAANANLTCLYIGSVTSGAMLSDVTADNITTYYGVNSWRSDMTMNSNFSSIKMYYGKVNGAALFIGPTLNNNYYNIKAFGSGTYGIQLSNITAAAGTNNWAIPFRNNCFDDIYVQDCGYAGYYAQVTQAVIGGAKTGFAFSGTDIFQQTIRIKSVNCAAGGGELKYTKLAPITVTPHGFLYNHVDVEVYSDKDNLYGIGLSQGDGADVYTDAGKHTVNVDINLVPPVPWVTLNHYDLFNGVSSNGFVWVCFGDGAGSGGQAGATAPGSTAALAPGAALYSTSGAVSSGTTLTFSSTTEASFTGAIDDGGGILAGTVLTVTGWIGNPLEIGMSIDGAGVTTPGASTPGTVITAFGTGTGGNGTYTVSRSQLVAAEAMTSTNIVDGAVIYVGTALADGTQVVSHTTTTVTTSAAIIANIPNASPVAMNTEVFDGTLYWSAYIPDRSARAMQLQAIYTSPTSGITVTGTIRNTYSGITLDCNHSADNTIADFTAQGLIVRGVVKGVEVIGGGALTNCELIDCTMQASNQWPGNNTAAISIAGGTNTLRVIGGRYSSSGISGTSQALVTTGTPTLTLSLFDVNLSSSGQAVTIVNGGTQAVTCKAARFATTTSSINNGMAVFAGSSVTTGPATTVNSIVGTAIGITAITVTAIIPSQTTVDFATITGAIAATTLNGAVAIGAAKLVVASAAGISVGMTVFAASPFVPMGTTVLKITGTSIFLSQPLSGNLATGAWVAFATVVGAYTRTTLAAAAAVGAGSLTVTSATAFVPLNINGNNTTWNWGAGSAINNADRANFAGWSTGSGTPAVRGKVLAEDLSTTPTSGAGGTKGGIGEYIDLATMNTAAHGYLCVGASNNWRALGYAKPLLSVLTTAVDFNAANTDNSIAIVLPSGFTRYVVREVWISGASHDISTATCGLFTAAAAGGTAIVASGSAITVTATTENTNNNAQSLAIATGATESFTAATLFFRTQTMEGAPATANVLLVYEPLS